MVPPPHAVIPNPSAADATRAETIRPILLNVICFLIPRPSSSEALQAELVVGVLFLGLLYEEQRLYATSHSLFGQSVAFGQVQSGSANKTFHSAARVAICPIFPEIFSSAGREDALPPL
jgi:hypothetical protein